MATYTLAKTKAHLSEILHPVLLEEHRASSLPQPLAHIVNATHIPAYPPGQLPDGHFPRTHDLVHQRPS